MKKILYIDRLDYFTLAIAFFLKPFFNKVYFHNALSIFEPKTTRKTLSNHGIHWISFCGVSLKSYIKCYKYNNELTQKAVKHRLSKSLLFKYCLNRLNLDSIGVQKLEASLKRNLVGHFISEGTSSFALMEHNFKNNETKIYYLPSTINNYLLSLELAFPIKSIFIHCFVLAFYFFTCKIMNELKNILRTWITLKPANIEQNAKLSESQEIQEKRENYDKYEIGFFPHMNLSYGPFFKKTYFYDNNPESLFYKRKVLTFFDIPTNPVSDRYLKIHGIPTVVLQRFKAKKYLFLKKIIRELGKLKKGELFKEVISLNQIVANCSVLIFLLLVYKYILVLCHFKSLKTIYFHNDILVDNSLLFACHLKSIQTMSSMERSISYTWDTGLIYDHYFTTGDAVRKELVERGYVSQYITLGLPRKAYIAESKNPVRYQRYINLKKEKTLILCFDLPPLTEFDGGLSGEFPAENGLKIFYADLLRLAKEMPKVHLLIKPKSTTTFQSTFYKDISSEIDILDNVEVVKNLRHFNPYSLAYLADIIIGKHTSIMEEAFAAGKKVIFHDSEGYLASLNYFLNKINIIESTYEGLKQRVEEIINQNNYLPAQEWEKAKKQYFNHGQLQDEFLLMKENIKRLHENHKRE